MSKMVKQKLGGEIVELEVDSKRTHENDAKLEVELKGAVDSLVLIHVIRIVSGS
jgi:hypothetical protein